MHFRSRIDALFAYLNRLDSMLVLISHLKNAHNALPYECHSCGNSFMDAHTTIKHFLEKTTCKRIDLKINIAPSHTVKNNFNLKPSFAFLDEAAKRAAQELFSKSTVIPSPTILTKNASQNVALPSKPAGKYEIKQPNTHDNNRKEITYNCIFCNWTAKNICVMEEHIRMHATNPSFLIQPTDNTTANYFETQMKVNAGSTATTKQVLGTSRFFDFGALISLLKQQTAFDPLLSIRTLTSTPTLPSEWMAPGPSAFKQVIPIPEQIAPVKDFSSYSGIYGIQQKQATGQLYSLFSDIVDNISCNSVTVISNCSCESRSKNFCSMNTTSSHIPKESSVNSNVSSDHHHLTHHSTSPSLINSSLPNHYISEGVIKAIQHYCQRRNALFSPILTAVNKTQRLDGFPKSLEDKTGQKNELEIAHDRDTARNDEDDFVDVVQLDN
uniref:C2H2-type domain-containing protein n=1 Tax=Loa loa TaxID=7209 RepID=A0A1I7VVK3_LOALO